MNTNHTVYTSSVADNGNVSLSINYKNGKPYEILEFTSIEDMEACSVARPFIPMFVWNELFEAYKAAQARYKPKFFGVN